ncbi:MAG: ATP-binding protein, partial [Kordiimonas sp.]
MKNLDPAQFSAHAQLKNIVGQEMINDDNIAIKELVKNSIDASAKRIEVQFEKSEKITEDSQIVISDDGSGMSMNDIEQKWLNIAYSAKKYGQDRNYAGNKGIGRFSADRLGRKLALYTRKKGA